MSSVVQVGTIHGDVVFHVAGDSRISVPLPYRFGVVPPVADVTQDRAVAKVLDEVLDHGDAAVLTGLGGTGKTELAAAYADRLWTARELDLLVWVNATSRQAVLSAYADLNANLTATEETIPLRGAERLLMWLGETSLRWLVVLDDVASPNDISGLWPPATRAGRVIVTTRRRDVPLRRRRQLIDVGGFSRAEALDYFRQALAGESHLLDGAEELAQELGYLPLAIKMACAYIRQTGVSCAEYRQQLFDRFDESGGLIRYPAASLQVAVGRAMRRAELNAPVGVARPLIEIVSLLSSDNIPLEVLTVPEVLELLSERVGRRLDRQDVLDELWFLAQSSLVTVDHVGSSVAVRTHDFVQRLMRESLSEERLAAVVRTAADALLLVWRGGYDPVREQTLRANAEALIVASGEHLWDVGCHPVLLRLGRSLGECGLGMEAEYHFRRLHEIATQRLGPQHPDTLMVLGELAHWRGMSGDAPGAVAGFQSLFEDRLRVLGRDHPDTLAARHNLAFWRGEAGDLAGAVAGFQSLFEDRLRVLGRDHPDTLAAHHNLAHWRAVAGDTPAAIEEFECLVQDYTSVLGPDDPSTLTARFNLGHWVGTAGDASRAISLLQQLLSDQVRVLGADHPDTLTTRHGLADWRGAAGDVDGAVTALEHLLQDLLRVLGVDHPDTVATKHGLADWRVAAGDAAGALDALEEVYDDRLRLLGPDHPNTLVAASNLAVVLRRLGEHAQVRELMSDVLERRRRVLGPDHPDTLRSADNLAFALRQLGRYEDARRLTEDVLERRRRVLGPDHPDTLRSADNLVVALRQLGRYEDARRLTEDVLERRRRTTGPDHSDTRRAARNLSFEDEIGVVQVLVSHQADSAGPLVDEIADALQDNGMVVWRANVSISPGSSFSRTIDDAVRASDVVLAVITDAGSVPYWLQREIEFALSQDTAVIPVYAGITPVEAQRSLPYELATRQGVVFDPASPQGHEQLVDAVRRSVVARGRLPAQTTEPTSAMLDPDELAAIRDLVTEAFATADRFLRVDDEQPQLFRPGPVWISTVVVPTADELERFAAHLANSRLGYFVHVGDLRGDARVVLDQMRLGGKPVVTITTRSLRAARADQRVTAFLNELERDYGNRDNLFDTKNALINERFLFGRDALLNTIGSALRRSEHVLVTGLRKVGKTSVLNILRQHVVDRPVCQVDLQRFDRHHEDWPPVLFAMMLSAFDRWGRAELGEWPFQTASPTTATELEAEFDRRQQYLVASGRPATTLLVILDELERIYPAKGESYATRQWIRASGTLRALAQGDRRHVVVVGADLRPGVNRDNDLGADGTNPFFAFFQEMPVPLLEREAVDEMVRSLGRAMAIGAVAEEFLSRLFGLTGGHPALVRTVAAEAYRQRKLAYELSEDDLDTALDHLDDADTVGFFLRNNLWQLMTTAEREVVRAVASGGPVAPFVSAADQREARSAMRSQCLIDEGVRIGMFRDWLSSAEL
ncbi:FxSxx-COOH system tetratricopeptide repeat protein [Saccharopolyspora sp. NPDC002376]